MLQPAQIHVKKICKNSGLEWANLELRWPDILREDMRGEPAFDKTAEILHQLTPHWNTSLCIDADFKAYCICLDHKI